MKRKINIDRPNLSSQEIASRQDFSSLMKQLPKVSKPPFYKTGWFITTVASVTGIAVITTNLILNDENSTPNQELAASASTETPPLENHNTSIITNVNDDNSNDLAITFVNETAPIEDTQNSDNNVETTQVDTDQMEEQIEKYESEMLDAKMAYEGAVANRMDLEANAPAQPKSQGNPDRQFVLDVSPNEFPELSAYKDLLFEVEANDPNFSPTVYNEEWEDIKLKTKEAGKTYYLSLFRGNTSKTFSVFPIFQGSNYDIALQKYQKELAIYQNELAQLKDTEEELKVQYDQSLTKLNTLKNQETNLSKTN